MFYENLVEGNFLQVLEMIFEYNQERSLKVVSLVLGLARG